MDLWEKFMFPPAIIRRFRSFGGYFTNGNYSEDVPNFDELVIILSLLVIFKKPHSPLLVLAIGPELQSQSKKSAAIRFRSSATARPHPNTPHG